jgi:hypothetical protein
MLSSIPPSSLDGRAEQPIWSSARPRSPEYEAWVIQLAPPCLRDWTFDGAVDTRDFFEFVSDFFSGAADFDHDGATTSADFFAFLEAFLAGCD